jgi:hypothetical protein
MNNTVSDRMRSILARLDRISNPSACLTAIPSPSPLIGLEIVHLYMALYPAENKYYVYVLNLRAIDTLPYITLPTEKIEWHDIPAATGMENKEWIPMDKCNQFYRYDSYAALHILPDFNTPPPIADPSNATWEPMSHLTGLATQNSRNIGRICSWCLREYIIPYLQAKHAHLLS